ncbi:MAG: VOC family protein [bacterium]|nr:VOC family protein [bacterium]
MKKRFFIILTVVLIGFGGLWADGGSEPQKGGWNMALKTTGGTDGLVFFKTQKLEALKDFYINEVGASMWMDQKSCVILRYGNFLFGFCQRDEADLDALITFFYEKKEDVDSAYKKFKDIATAPPRMNPNYPIYNFFAKDPEGRNIEFQYFTGLIDWQF